jgi:esterase/lipase superfamily enzyme
VVAHVDPLSASRFFEDVALQVLESTTRDVLIFVPGYNVTFEDGIKRTAQVAVDLQFPGAPLLYSWPSEESAGRYLSAEENAVWSHFHLKDFLLDVVRQSGAERIYILAHSMGNRVVVAALEKLALESPAALPMFRHVVMTAPDIDAAVLRQVATAVTRTAHLITLYASTEDLALEASATVHDHVRAGLATQIFVVPGVETIDATGIDSSFLKHSYFGETDVVLNDVYSLLRHDKPASERFGLVLSSSPFGSYWRFAPR